jgi:hypothetical protein
LEKSKSNPAARKITPELAMKPIVTAKYLFICACVYSNVLSALFDAFKLLTAYLASKEN